MKFVVSSTALLNVLQTSNKVVSNKNTLPILDNFLFELKDGVLKITASDLETTMIGTLKVDSMEQEGVIAAPVKLMIDSLKEFSEQPLTIEANESTWEIQISWKTGKLAIPGTSGLSYPTQPALDEETKQEISVDTNLLLTGINKTIFATADDELRPVMNGVYVNIEPQAITFVATDAHKLVKYAASAVHHIYDKDVADCPTFREIAKSLWAYIEGCDFGGYNSNKFDIPVLVEEFLRAGLDVDLHKSRFIDVQNIFHKMEHRPLVAADKFSCGKELDEAHSAEADTLATYEVLLAQLDRYPELKNEVDYLAEFSSRGKCADYAGRIVFDEKGVEVFSFGKHKGRPVAEVFRTEPSYYAWMMNGDFPLYTKKVITAIRLRELNNKE